jgi:ATPase subunit of ABC transporter with duplicated ATPase domains
LTDPIPKPPKPLRFKAAFTSGDIRSAEIIRVQGVTKSYDGNLVLDNLDFTLGPGARIAVLGPNGCGKTTLLRILAGRDVPDSGTIVLAPGVRLGHLPQEPENVDSSLTVLDYYRRDLPGREEDFIFSLVTCGLFGYDEIRKTLDQLSLGQVRSWKLPGLSHRNRTSSSSTSRPTTSPWIYWSLSRPLFPRSPVRYSSYLTTAVFSAGSVERPISFKRTD